MTKKLVHPFGPLCDNTWPSPTPTKNDDTYRQHRCGRRGRHDNCRCRYCLAWLYPTGVING